MQAGKTLLQSIVWRGLYYVTAFAINILIARHFQASVSGAVYYMSSLYALILLFTSLSMESGIIYFIARKEMPAAGLFNFSILWALLTGGIVFFVLLFVDGDGYGGMPRPLLIFSALSFISGNMLSTYSAGFFYGRNQFIAPNAINIICTLLLIALLPFQGSPFLPWINNDNYFYIYFGSFLLQGICLSLVAKIRYIKWGPPWFLSRTDFRLLFRYCSMAFAGNIIYFLLYRIDYWFVEKYCTADQLGNYIQVSKLGHLFFILPTILAGAVFPITAGGKKENIAQVLTLLSRSIFFFYLLACVLLALTGKWLFPFVFGQSFSAMYPAFLLLIPGILALSGLFTLTAYFAGKNQVRTNITGSVYALAIVVAGDIIFIPEYGIQAAALVSSIGYIAYQGYILVLFKKEFDIPLQRFFVMSASDFRLIKKNAAAFIRQRNKVGL